MLKYIYFSNIEKGLLFETEMDETLLQPRTGETNYFMRASEQDFDEIFRNFNVEQEEDVDDEDEDDELTQFERLAKKMQNLTPDGGVKKRV